MDCAAALPSSPLAVAAAFRAFDADMPLNAVTAFLFICENEGLSQTELCKLMDEPPYVVTRLISYLGAGAPHLPGGRRLRREGLGLVERSDWNQDGRVKVLNLTPEGRALRDRLNASFNPPRLL